jgi:hypothetical protein
LPITLCSSAFADDHSGGLAESLVEADRVEDVWRAGDELGAQARP